MADSAGYAASRKRNRESSGRLTKPTPFDYQESRSSANRRFEFNRDKKDMAKKRSIRSSGRARTSRRRSGGRRRGASARRTASSYVPPKAYVSWSKRGARALVERVPTLIQRSLNPFPPTWKGHLTYGLNDTITTAAASPVWVTKAYGMNNMFDPDTSLGGQQPYQYDQMTGANGPYHSVTVLGFSYSVKFQDPTGDGGLVGVFWRGYGDANGNPSGQDLKSCIERGRCDYQALNNTGSQCADFSGYIDLPSLIGLTPDQYIGQLEYGHLWNGSPQKRLDFYTGFIDPNSLVTPLIIRYTGWLRYHCIFSNLQSLPQS